MTDSEPNFVYKFAFYYQEGKQIFYHFSLMIYNIRLPEKSFADEEAIPPDKYLDNRPQNQKF